MEVNNQKSQAAKLTRTQSSSLLRSSPTVRSSIHSLSSVTEMIEQQDPDLDLDLEEQKPHAKPKPAVQPPNQTQSRSLAPVLAILSVSGYALYAFLTKHGQGLSTSENLLLSLTLVALLLFIVSRNKTLLNAAANQLCSRLRFCSKTGSEPAAVEWFIGETEKHDDRRPTTQKQGSSSGFKKINIREGVELYGNGDVYEGEFHKGRCNGSGVYSYLVNGRYEGDWIDGKYDGYGVESWARGSRYRGQYRQGLRHGYGVYRFYTGDSYAGEWCNGQSHGVGVQTCADGSCYGGEFRSGVKHGIGCYHFRNGDRYAGEYFGDKIHGFGVYHFANGHYYEGSWHEGRKQGYGMYTFRNGEGKCGEWDGGNLKIALPTLTDAVLRAVQAARKTAESAIHLRRVDEQVNRAVMAANKAATAARVAAVKAVQNRIDGDFCDTNM